MPSALPAQTPVWKKMGLLFVMFIMQNISLGFTWTLLPLLMREQGLSLGAIGLSAMIYSPWALKFMWASQVDRHYSHRLGKRKSWIVPLSAFNLVLLSIIALIDPQNYLPLVLITVFLLNVNIATTDIAVDGYATDILKPRERSLGNTVQIVGYILGHMLGSGVFLITYQYMGWFYTLLLMVGLHLLLFLPVVTHREIQATGNVELDQSTKASKPSARAFLKISRIRWFLVFLALLSISQNAGAQLHLTMLADLGFNPSDLGKYLLWVGSPLSILGSLVWGLVITKWGVMKGFILGGSLGVGLCWFSSLIPEGVCDLYWAAAIMLGWSQFVFGAMLVLIYSIIMDLSAGSQSATNYAVLCSLNHMFSVGILPIAGSIGEVTGYPCFFTGLGLFYVFTLITGGWIMRYRIIMGNPPGQPNPAQPLRTQI